jgi:hypothetical protein
MEQRIAKRGEERRMVSIAGSRAEISAELRRRARYHHVVGAITAASAAVVLLTAVVLAVLWIVDPLFNIKAETRGQTGAIDSSLVLVSSGVRLTALAIVGYLVRLLTSIYRYNTQLWNHYATRALALELADDQAISLASAVAALSASNVTFGPADPVLESSLPLTDNH